MNKRIFCFNLDGSEVTGFDTGLDARSFAQAKMARFINHKGFIVYPDGRIAEWLPGGLIEKDTMILWGPVFPGEELTGIMEAPDRKAEALDALRFWLKAQIAVGKDPRSLEETPFHGPAGVFITAGKTSTEYNDPFPAGTFFFPPAWLFQCSPGAETEKLNILTHPDLRGDDGIPFSAGIMLYRIFCGADPFSGDDAEKIRIDIREANFIPPGIAAPGLDNEMQALISTALSPPNTGIKKQNRIPPPEFILDFLGPPSSRPPSSWQKELGDEEISKLRSVEEQYRKRTAIKIKARRFVHHNTAIIAALIIAICAALLIAKSFEERRSALPGTAGMNPAQVAEAYYAAFADLDHATMEACTSGRAGKIDIDMAAALFVITKVRQAYETSPVNFMPAREWVEAGRPPSEKTVFGITDLNIRVLSGELERGGGDAGLEAEYILWMPGEYSEDEKSAKPEGTAIRDRLHLAFKKNAWRITNIDRTQLPIQP